MSKSERTERAVPDTRTGPLVQKLVDGLREDVTDIVGHLQRGREILGVLEGETKGVNGLSSMLKAQGAALEEMIRNLRDAADSAEKKMLGKAGPVITERVAEGPREAES